jgi:hypothetical protein
MSRRIVLLGLTVLSLSAASLAAAPHGTRKALSTCVQQCLKSGEDLICCNYICHPIGMNPC